MSACCNDWTWTAWALMRSLFVPSFSFEGTAPNTIPQICIHPHRFDEDVQFCGDMLRGLLAQLGTPPVAGAASTAVSVSGSAAAAATAAAASDAVDPGDVFLDVALLPLLDVNHDMVITLQELYVFQVYM